MGGPSQKYSGPNHLGPHNTSPYPTHRLASSISLVDTAREIETASAAVAHQTSSQLRVIAEQIRFLQQQAQGILDKARADVDLHHAECRFVKTPGNLYHLYQRPDGSHYFSLLSPEEHGGHPPHAHVGTYRLEADKSWTPAEQVESRDAAMADVTHLALGPGQKSGGG